MTPLATVADVEARLRPDLRSLATEDAIRTDGLIEEASVKALAHLGKSESYFDTVAVPLTVTVVVSRMVARVLEQSSAGIVPGTQQTGTTTGPFSGQTTFVAGSSNGSPWLTRSDQADLDAAFGANKAFGVDRVACASVHDLACALNFGAEYCSCGADIAGRVIFGV